MSNSYTSVIIEEPLDLFQGTAYKLRRKRSDFSQHGNTFPQGKVYWYNRTGPQKDQVGTTTNIGVTGFSTRPKDIWTCEDAIRNPDYDQEVLGVPTDTGSEFKNFKATWKDDNYVNYVQRYVLSSVWIQDVKVPVFVVPDTSLDAGFNPRDSIVAPSQDSDMSSYGPTGWARYRPTRPTVDLAVFVGEIKDLPRLLQVRLEGIKSLSDVWLAAQYGWVPLLADIKAMLNFVDTVNKRIDFFIKNAGKPVLGKGKVASSADSYVVSAQSGVTSLTRMSYYLAGRYGNPANTGAYKSSCVCDVAREVWFAGSYIFWFSGKTPSRTDLAVRLAGVRITPATLWELIPWSWLIDWYTNIGDVLSNLQTEVADNQLTRYAYIMGHTTRKYTWSATDGIVAVSVSREFDTKVRQRVNPFGVSVDKDNLSLRQLSILGALGISRSLA